MSNFTKRATRALALFAATTLLAGAANAQRTIFEPAAFALDRAAPAGV